MRRRTLLVIAHRIGTIMDCDALLVLSNGRLVEQGTPQALAAQVCDRKHCMGRVLPTCMPPK